MWYENVGRIFFRFITMHAFDRRTDGQTDRKALAIPCVHFMQSHGKKSATKTAKNKQKTAANCNFVHIRFRHIH